MPKGIPVQKTAAQILEDYNKSMTQHRISTDYAARRIIERAYASGDTAYIDAVSLLMKKLDKLSDIKGLEDKLPAIINSLTEEPSREVISNQEKPNISQKELSLTQASDYLMQQDRKSKRKTLSKAGYDYRVRSLIKKHNLAVRKESATKKFIDAEDFYNLASVNYSSNIRNLSSSEIYASLRLEGNSPNDIYKKSPELFHSKGKNPRKVLGAFEGCYQRDIVSKK
jgi:hypothetical protein